MPASKFLKKKKSCRSILGERRGWKRAGAKISKSRAAKAARIDWIKMEERGQKVIKGRKSQVPIVPLGKGRNGTVHNYNLPGKCSGFATRIARRIFGLNYIKGDAWKLALVNKSVKKFWRLKKGRFEYQPVNVRELVDSGILKPGMLIGVYFPPSRHNKHVLEEARHGRAHPYTHVMVFLGQWGTDYMVIHNIEGPAIEPMEQALMNYSKRPSQIAEIIAPKPRKS